MAKFTQGPWINKHFRSNGAIEIGSCNYRTVSTQTPMVRVYPRLDYTEEHGPHNSDSAIAECEANARLIAAAPDLLVALKELELWTTLLLDGSLIGWPLALLGQVRNTIKSAEGITD